MATRLVQIANDPEIRERLEAERIRLRKIAGLDRNSREYSLNTAGLPNGVYLCRLVAGERWTSKSLIVLR